MNLISAKSAGTINVGGLHVNRLGFGAMRITGPGAWGNPANQAVAKQLLQHAVNLDVNFIDTADAYGPHISENLIAEALHPYDGVVIATKGGNTRPSQSEWVPDCSPQHLRQACEDSLKRLKLDRIDLYQLHTVDPRTPFRDSFVTLLELQREGKIRYIGLSNIEPEHFSAALEMGKVVSVQNNYNVLNREHEDVLKLCEEQGVAFIPYFPVGGGQHGGLGHQVLSDVAEAHQASTHQIALAWLLQHSPVMLPIPGTSSIEHLEANVAAASIQLTKAEIAKLDSIY